MFSYAIAHAALVRRETPGIPLDLDTFVDGLDDFEPLDVTTNGAAGARGPYDRGGQVG